MDRSCSEAAVKGKQSEPRLRACPSTAAGAKVFAAGSLDFGGSADQWPITQILENVWERLSAP